MLARLLGSPLRRGRAGHRPIVAAIVLSLLAALAVAPVSAASDGLRLVMVEQSGCAYCLRWHEEIGPIYAKTPEGAAAPLERVHLRADLPQGMQFDSPAVFTPTFVLLRDGAEVGRIEGYPGEDFFWGLLGQMLAAAGSPVAP